MDELTALLRRAATGDRLALASFIRASQADVWRFCAHLVDPGSADDLTQEVYVRAMRSMHRFRGDASARTWLLAVARNVAADEIRRRQRRRRTEPAAPISDETPAEVEAIAVQDLIDRLDPERRAAFVLTQQLGFSYREAATTLGVPIGTVRSRVARGREQLITALRDLEPARDQSNPNLGLDETGS